MTEFWTIDNHSNLFALLFMLMAITAMVRGLLRLLGVIFRGWPPVKNSRDVGDIDFSDADLTDATIIVFPPEGGSHCLPLKTWADCEDEDR